MLTTKTKKELKMFLGRFGHSAAYAKDENVIYIFAGQQEHVGGKTTSARDFQNDLWRLCLSTGKYERQMISHMMGLSRRIYCTSFIISQFIFAVGGLSVDGNCLSEILMIDTERKFCR